jgi:hypothetical protein
MAEVTNGRDVAHSGSLRVEDLIFLDDLRALGVPWIDRLIDRCASHEDVELVWALIRMGGPDDEDAGDVLELSAHMPQLEDEVQKILRVIRVLESYRS